MQWHLGKLLVTIKSVSFKGRAHKIVVQRSLSSPTKLAHIVLVPLVPRVPELVIIPSSSGLDQLEKAQVTGPDALVLGAGRFFVNLVQPFVVPAAPLQLHPFSHGCIDFPLGSASGQKGLP